MPTPISTLPRQRYCQDEGPYQRPDTRRTSSCGLICPRTERILSTTPGAPIRRLGSKQEWLPSPVSSTSRSRSRGGFLVCCTFFCGFWVLIRGKGGSIDASVFLDVWMGLFWEEGHSFIYDALFYVSKEHHHLEQQWDKQCVTPVQTIVSDDFRRQFTRR